MPIHSDDDVVLVRRKVRAWSVELGFGLVDQTKMVTAASVPGAPQNARPSPLIQRPKESDVNLRRRDFQRGRIAGMYRAEDALSITVRDESVTRRCWRGCFYSGLGFFVVFSPLFLGPLPRSLPGRA